MTDDDDDDVGAGGYRKGTAAELAASALLDGGFSRTEIMRHLRDNYSESNNWSVTISTVVTDLTSRGYTAEGWYRLLPPAPLVRRKARPVPRRLSRAEEVQFSQAQRASFQAEIDELQTALNRLGARLKGR